jgi:hypothetical protein
MLDSDGRQIGDVAPHCREQSDSDRLTRKTEARYPHFLSEEGSDEPTKALLDVDHAHMQATASVLSEAFNVSRHQPLDRHVFGCDLIGTEHGKSKRKMSSISLCNTGK